jgi:hypothetical protein
VRCECFFSPYPSNLAFRSIFDPSFLFQTFLKTCMGKKSRLLSKGRFFEVHGFWGALGPESVLDYLPSCDVQIVDFMWLLYRFYTPHSACHPREFIAFASSNAERFFTVGGSVFVFCFDTPALVPLAKAEEHAQRAKRKTSANC